MEFHLKPRVLALGRVFVYNRDLFEAADTQLVSVFSLLPHLFKIYIIVCVCQFSHINLRLSFFVS